MRYQLAASLLIILLLRGAADAQQTVSERDQVVDHVIEWINGYRALPALQIVFQVTYEPLNGPPKYGISALDVEMYRKGEKLKTIASLTDLKTNTVDIRKTTWDGEKAMTQVHSATVVSDISIGEEMHAWTLGYRIYDDYIFSPEGDARYREMFSQLNLPESDYWLPFALTKNREQYQMVPSENTADGLATMELKRGDSDRIWIVPERGFAIARRELRLESGELSEATVLSDFRNVGGVWLPHLIERHEYGLPTGPQELRGEATGICRLVVKSIASTPLNNDEFQLQITHGTRVIDNTRHVVYRRVGPGEYLLDKVANVVAQGKPPSWRTFFLIGVTLAALITLVVIVAMRRRHG